MIIHLPHLREVSCFSAGCSLSTDRNLLPLGCGIAAWTTDIKRLLWSSSLSQNINDLEAEHRRAELASTLTSGLLETATPLFPMNITHFLFLLPQMTVQEQGYLVTVTFPNILAFNQPSVCISGTFLPKGFLRAARFHSCLL